MRGPAGHARNGEHRGEQVHRNAQIVVQRGTVKINVTGRSAFLRLRKISLAVSRSGSTFRTSGGCRYARPRPWTWVPGCGPGVVHVVDRVAEPENLAAGIELGVDEIRYLVRAASLSSICMTLAFAPPCSAPDSEPTPAVTAAYMCAWVEATSRAAKVEALKACSACSTRSCRWRGWRFPPAPGVQHVKEVGGMAELGRRRYCVQAVADAVPGGDNGRKLGDQPMGHAQGGLPRVFRDVGVMVGKHGHRRLEDVHRQRLDPAASSGRR